MGSGPLRGRSKGEPRPGGAPVGTSGQGGSKPSGPDSSRIIVGLPLRIGKHPTPSSNTAVVAAKKAMAEKDEVIVDATHIFVVMGASVSRKKLFFSSLR